MQELRTIVEWRISVTWWSKVFASQRNLSRRLSALDEKKKVEVKLPVSHSSWQMANALLWKKLVESIKVIRGMCSYRNKTMACFGSNYGRQVWETTQTEWVWQLSSFHLSLGLQELDPLMDKKIKGFAYLFWQDRDSSSLVLILFMSIRFHVNLGK